MLCIVFSIAGLLYLGPIYTASLNPIYSPSRLKPDVWSEQSQITLNLILQNLGKVVSNGI